MDSFVDIQSFELAALGSVLFAALLGSLIGLERALAGKTAGMRTYALVSLGSCLLTVVSVIVTERYLGLTMFDPLRVAAAIVMGVGFIGSGLVMRQEDRPVGLTTSAGLWVASGLGITVGFGYFALAVGTTLITILIFSGLAKVEELLAGNLRRNAPKVAGIGAKKNSD